jgi:hypothetical protein
MKNKSIDIESQVRAQMPHVEVRPVGQRWGVYELSTPFLKKTQATEAEAWAAAWARLQRPPGLFIEARTISGNEKFFPLPVDQAELRDFLRRGEQVVLVIDEEGNEMSDSTGDFFPYDGGVEFLEQFIVPEGCAPCIECGRPIYEFPELEGEHFPSTAPHCGLCYDYEPGTLPF